MEGVETEDEENAVSEGVVADIGVHGERNPSDSCRDDLLSGSPVTNTLVKKGYHERLAYRCFGAPLHTAKSGRLTKIVRNMIELPSYQKSVIVGLLLSDG